MPVAIHDSVSPRERFEQFDPDTRRPLHRAPPGSCDSQIHVFGPLDRYPVRADAVFEAPGATIQAARTMHGVLGIERCVVVQSTVYGYDHAAMLDALELGGTSCRGVAMINGETTDRELMKLHDAGVRGARFNFFPGVNMISDPASFSRSVARIAEMGWFAKVHPSNGGLCDLMELLEALRIPALIDHFGRPRMELGPNADPTVNLIVELLKRGNWWVMLSNPHRFSRLGSGMDDMVEVAVRYLDAAPRRLVWGTDWPHPLSREKVPNDGDVLDFMYRYAQDADTQRHILVENPAELFQFASQTGASIVP
jgi:2-pyrone-4,6-dicarboxylate lactonase